MKAAPKRPLIGPRLQLDRAALFLDLDGTLAQIERRPEDVRPDAARTELLRQACTALGGRVAIVSGRTIDEIDLILGFACVAACGVHGLQRRSASGEVVAAEAHVSIRYAGTMMAALARSQPGLSFEDKHQSVALHYRGAPAAEAAVIEFAERLAEAEALVVQRGDKVVELRTPGPDKGAAVRAFLKEAPFRGHVPIYIGDDLTDEVGFREAAAHGGVGMLVGDRRPTDATVSLADPAAVHGWIGDGLASGAFQFGGLSWVA